MQLRTIKALRGPNLWTRQPALEAWVELGTLRDLDGVALRAAADRLRDGLPGLPDASGWRLGLAEGLGHAARELQTQAWKPTAAALAAPTAEPDVVRVVIPYIEESLARESLAAAHALCLAALRAEALEFDGHLDRLRRHGQGVGLGPSTASIVEAARERGIPARRLSADCSLVQLGHGAAQRRIWTAETDQTGVIAEAVAKDKELTRMVLRAVGVPVPEGRPALDAEDAWAAARSIGVPVVIKPQDGNHGRGVATNLRTREQVETAFANAKAEGDHVLVERFAPGDDYRLLVIGGKLVAAARREPAQVVGDGVHTIARLVEEVNKDPRRGEDHATALSKIPLDAVSLEVLAEQGYTPDSVPPAGQRVLIRRNANLSTGGTATDVTDSVHPEVAARAVEAAKAVGLDIAGIDVVALDIARAMEEQGAVVVEVNAGPGLRMHLEPSAGQPRPVGRAIVEMLFPEGQTGRIPIVAVTGVNGKTTTTALIAHVLAETGKRIGSTRTGGIFVGDRRIESGDCSGPKSARKILMNPAVEAAVFECARGGILREGLGFDRCDVAVVTNIGEGDHLGLADVHTVEDLARVKRVIVEAVGFDGTAVLNAADPLVVAMAPHCLGSIVYFAQDPDLPAIAEHRAKGGRAVVVRHGEIVLAEGMRETGLTLLSDVPLTHGGRIGFQVENTLAAAAAAWAMGMELDAIRGGLESFAAEMDRVPARFNLLEIGGATVVLDYGHNVSALRALIEAIDVLPHERRHVVYSAAGDRRDEDMVAQGELLAGAFDAVYLYEDASVRGRAPGEITALFRRGLAVGPRVRHVHEERGALACVGQALRAVRPGDLLVVQADEVDETLAFIRRYLDGGVAGREIDLAEALESQPADAVLAAD
jgi:cyanophycin synthetase